MGHQLGSYKRLLGWKQRNIRVQKPLGEGDLVTCKHCGNVYFGRFCPNCGQKAKTKRFTLSGIFQEAFDLLTNFDHSFFRTIIELFYRPGYMIRDYLQGHRVCYFKPLQLLAFMSTIFWAVSYVLDMKADEIFQFTGNLDNEEVANIAEEMKNNSFRIWIRKIAELVEEKSLLSTLITVILFAIPARFCFQWTPFGKEMNLTEHVYARAYLSCQILIVKTIFLPLEHINDGTFSALRVLLICWLTIWDYAQLMGIRKRRSLRLCIATLCLMGVVALILIIPVAFIAYHLSKQFVN